MKQQHADFASPQAHPAAAPLDVRRELSELRSSTYAAVHRMRRALRAHCAASSDICEADAPQQLQRAVDELLAVLQVRRPGNSLVELRGRSRSFSN